MDFNEAVKQRARLDQWDAIDKKIVHLKDERAKLAEISGNASTVQMIDCLRIGRQATGDLNGDLIILYNLPFSDYELKVFLVNKIDEHIAKLRELQAEL